MIRERMAGFFSLVRLCLSAAKAAGLNWLAMSPMTCCRTLALGWATESINTAKVASVAMPRSAREAAMRTP